MKYENFQEKTLKFSHYECMHARIMKFRFIKHCQHSTI